MTSEDPTWVGISHHEAGHAVALYAWDHRFDAVRLGADGEHTGATRLTLTGPLDERTRVELASVALCGVMAEMRHYRRAPLALRGSDVALMFQGLQRFHTEDWRRFRQLTGADAWGRSRWTGFVLELAASIVEGDWPLIARCAAALRERGALRWEDMAALHADRLAS